MNLGKDSIVRFERLVRVSNDFPTRWDFYKLSCHLTYI
jgi:hypothetical protein